MDGLQQTAPIIKSEDNSSLCFSSQILFISSDALQTFSSSQFVRFSSWTSFPTFMICVVDDEL